MAKYNITNESQLIDLTAITNGCTQIEAAAQYFEECAQKVFNASDMLDENALAVDKTTMQPQLDADAEYIQSIKTAIENFTLQVKNVALQVYAEQQAELADYKAQQLAAQQAAQQAANNGGTTTP